jgi:hypothetical protein
MRGKPGTGGAEAPWNFTVPLPRTAQRRLKAWAAENGVELRDIGVEGLKLWAAKHRVVLPPLDIEETEEDGARVVVN